MRFAFVRWPQRWPRGGFRIIAHGQFAARLAERGRRAVVAALENGGSYGEYHDQLFADEDEVKDLLAA